MTSVSGQENPTRITPTGPGYILMLMLLAMLIGSINYGNNMAYILCFLLTALMMTGYLATRNNLKGLEIKNVLSQPAFAGDIMQISFELHNNASGPRVTIYPAAYDIPKELSEGYSGPYAVAPYSRTTGKISFTVPKRGRFVLTHITLYSVYPLGLFRAHRQVKVDKIYIVYPKAMGSRRWPEPELHEDEYSEGFYVRGGDDFVGVRPYRPGESMHHVDWKAYARGRPLSLKEFSGGGSSQLWFDWNHLEGTETERRLSQICRWVLEADQEGKEFGLRLPGNDVRLDCSPGHTQKSLEALAVFDHRSLY